MGASVELSVIGASYAASLVPKALAFQRDLRRPEARQAELLRAFLRDNAETAYGKAHGYAGVCDARAFQDRVPIVDYDALAPWVERAAQGEANVLTREPLVIFERSSGSTSGNKLIPYTASLLAAFSRATSPWLFDLYTRRRRLLRTRAYWSVSPVAQDAEKTAGGTSIGFEDDTAYFGPLARWAIQKTLAVPSDIARVRDIDTWRRRTAVALLGAEDLGLISVWSPSFLTLLIAYIEQNLASLVRELPTRRGSFVQRALDKHGGFVGAAIWPELTLISCWTDGHARDLVPALARYFPGTEIQGKGLLATEGVVSLPLLGVAAPVAAVSSHFLELIDLERPNERPKLVHELVKGKQYSPLLTTPGGFARYHLKDIVECVGHHHETPMLRFLGKLDRNSDLAGEKLTAAQVSEALGEARAETRVDYAFAMLAPLQDPTLHYTLFVESAASDEQLNALARALEARLLESYHYKYCRDLGQLGPLRAQRVTAGWQRYVDAQLRRGMRLGDIKPTPLDGRLGWETHLLGRA